MRAAQFFFATAELLVLGLYWSKLSYIHCVQKKNTHSHFFHISMNDVWI